MPIPECKQRPNQDGSSQSGAENALSEHSWQPLEIKSSVIERWLFAGAAMATLLVILTHPALISGSDELSLYLRLVIWISLSGLGGYQLWAQPSLFLHYYPTYQFKTIDNKSYEFELVWALMPRMMLVRYRCFGGRWRLRTIWPDSANEAALRVLRASLTSLR